MRKAKMRAQARKTQTEKDRLARKALKKTQRRVRQAAQRVADASGSVLPS